MQKPIKRVTAKNSTADEMAGLPILYSDRLNTTEIAAILIDKMVRLCIKYPELAMLVADASEDFDLDKLSKLLLEAFDPDIVDTFMDSEYGQGVLFGFYLNIYLNELAEQEEEAQDLPDGAY